MNWTRIWSVRRAPGAGFRAHFITGNFPQWRLKPSWFGAGRMLALSVLGLGAALTALAADPTPVPLLRLETGMHTAPIKRIATDAAGRYAVSASDDKTARVWEVATGPSRAGAAPAPGCGQRRQALRGGALAGRHDRGRAGWTGWDWDQQVVDLSVRA